MSTNHYQYGRPVNQLDITIALGSNLNTNPQAGISPQVILPGGLPAGSSGNQLLLWNGSSWTPTTIDAVMRIWFNGLSTTLPGSTNTFWNDGGLLAST